MCVEIEAKLKVDSLQEIADKLNALGAEFLQEQMQTDYYFDDANRTLTKADTCLRLRRQRAGETESLFLTYKGAKEKDEFKKRQEIEIEVTNADSVEKLLSAIGYSRALVVEKKRRVWRFCSCSVALDELPSLGNFVEIEGPDSQTITDVQGKLELAELSHIPRSYASLMAEKIAH
ncbi:MAG: class IV adenylate cyclase [Planctomycetota bacterium]|nr:MAG: class IV adenylate cyclase [Planctomycetota bacterium]